MDGRLAHWEERLAGLGYARIHRNAIVRLDAVKELTDQGEVVLTNTHLQVSIRRLEEIRTLLGL
ncbi:MAG: LytTR family transcriptional regulator DNA-binding domain-containing protein [Holophaga sp.]|nr:LytTR family transcriptional regulator DNA-binding domain-containing protein [Holophaga sp.]